MRLLERALIVATLGVFVSNLLTDFVSNKFLPIFLVHTALAILTLAYDGIRLAQVPILLSMVIYYILGALLISPVNLIVNSVGLALSIFTCGLNLLFGECDFDKLNPSGQYQVGFREFRLNHRHGLTNEVSVFYPISREVYARSIGRKNV